MLRTLPLLLAALAAPAAAQQVHPPQYAGASGNSAEWLDGSFMRDRMGTTVDGFQPQTVRGIAFRAAFRDTRPASYGPMPACSLDAEIRMSHSVAPANAVGTKLDQHNHTVQTVLPRTVVNFPAVQPASPIGGFDAWFPEPFAYRFTFTTPFVVPTTTAVHYTLTLHSYTRPSFPQWDAVQVDYGPAQIVPSAEYGSNSVFLPTVCGTYQPQVAETTFVHAPWLGGPQILMMDLRRAPAQETVLLLSFGWAPESFFATPNGFCSTMINLHAMVAMPIADRGGFATWPMPLTPLGQHLVSHRLVVQGGQIVESGGTHAHRSLNDWHSGSTPNARSQFSWLSVNPQHWAALVTEFF